jgi:hypothetical protein
MEALVSIKKKKKKKKKKKTLEYFKAYEKIYLCSRDYRQKIGALWKSCNM